MGQDDLGSEKGQIILKTNSQSISIFDLSHNAQFWNCQAYLVIGNINERSTRVAPSIWVSSRGGGTLQLIDWQVYSCE